MTVEGPESAGYRAHYVEGKRRKIARKRKDPTSTSTYSLMEGEKDQAAPRRQGQKGPRSTNGHLATSELQ